MFDLVMQPDCGCTTLSNVSSTLEAGAQSSVEVKLNPANMRGRIVKNIAARWRVQGDPDFKYETLHLQALVQPLYRLHPQQIDFSRGHSSDILVELIDINGTGAPDIKNVTCSTRTLTAKIRKKDNDSVKPGIAVSYVPNELPEINQTSASIFVTVDDQQQSRIELPVRFITLK